MNIVSPLKRVGDEAQSLSILLFGSAVLSAAALMPLGPVRALASFPLALVIPGYAAVLALFGINKRIDTMPTVALSLLLSLALYPLLTLLLYAIGLQISRLTIVVGTDCLVVCLAAAALVRTFASTSARRHPQTQLTFAPAESSRTFVSGPRIWLLFLAAISISVAVITVEIRKMPPIAVDPYTQFYLAGQWAQLDTIIYRTSPAPLRVAVGVGNFTNTIQRYRIVPMLDGAISGPDRVITLAKNQSWTGSVVSRGPTDNCLHRLSVNLYQGQSQSEAQTLTTWIQGRMAGHVCVTTSSTKG